MRISIKKLVKLLNEEYKKNYNETFNMFKYKDNIIYYKHEIFIIAEFLKLKEAEFLNNHYYKYNKVYNFSIYNYLINFLWRLVPSYDYGNADLTNADLTNADLSWGIKK